MLAVMSRCRGASGIRTAASVAILTAVLAGCGDNPTPQATSTTSPATAVTTPPTTDTPTATPIPTYTPPPSRGLKRPPGVAPVAGIPCDPASSDAHFYEVAWFSSFASYAAEGKPVPDYQWAGASGDLSVYLSGTPKARSALLAAGVPTSYVAYRDLADLDAAMREGIAVAKARDESRVLSVYFKVKTAHDHLIESCGALER
jgi:hypothetical protein